MKKTLPSVPYDKLEVGDRLDDGRTVTAKVPGYRAGEVRYHFDHRMSATYSCGAFTNVKREVEPALHLELPKGDASVLLGQLRDLLRPTVIPYSPNQIGSGWSNPSRGVEAVRQLITELEHFCEPQGHDRMWTVSDGE